MPGNLKYHIVSKFGKWLGGGLGWAMGGPIGALIGFALGAALDDSGAVVKKTGVRPPKTQRGDFAASLLVLIAAVLKADGEVLKSEVEYVKQFLVRHFGVELAREQMLMLKEMLKQDIPLPSVCTQIRQSMEYASRLQLLHFLFGLSKADGKIKRSERDLLLQISEGLGIREPDYMSILAMFVPQADGDYQILEIEPSATDEEVKKAYKRMAVKHHPDKVSHLGQDLQELAKEKFQQVQTAYENIRRSRGI